jgi:hypothetical protein
MTTASQLYSSLTDQGVTIALDELGGIACKAPKESAGTLQQYGSDIKEHKATLVQALTRWNESTMQGKNASYRPNILDLLKWQELYNTCSWYANNELGDSPVFLALEYACFDHIGSCQAWFNGSLLHFYGTYGSVENLDPIQFTDELRKAYESQDEQAITGLATLFHGQERTSQILNEYHKLQARNGHTTAITGKANSVHPTLSQEQEQVTTDKLVPPLTKSESQDQKRARSIAYVDVCQGTAITDDGTKVSFQANCSLPDLLTVPELMVCSRLYIVGQQPGAGNYETWLLNPVMLINYASGKRGHYIDAQDTNGHVARYQDRVSGNAIEIRRINTWLGDGDYTNAQARAAMQIVLRYLQGSFWPDAQLYGTPALTFQQIFNKHNRLQKKMFPVLSQEIRDVIHRTSGQGRIEFTGLDELDTIPGIKYYDGIFMYAALTWGLPTELATWDSLNEYAGKVPARYRIRYTVPANWHHVGLFMTPKGKNAWCYPGKDERGQTFETWVDGSELDVLGEYYLSSAPATLEKSEREKRALMIGFQSWDITILERIVFKPEKESKVTKPLNTITDKLVTIREKLKEVASQDEQSRLVYTLAAGAIRNILLHGIGSFNRTERDVTYIQKNSDPAPDGFTKMDEIGNGLISYQVPQKTEAYTQQFEHPEWCALVWARCRARMLKALLTLPREQILAIRTDAIALTHERPEWNNQQGTGKLRLKKGFTKKVPAPHSFQELDKLLAQYSKEVR